MFPFSSLALSSGNTEWTSIALVPLLSCSESPLSQSHNGKPAIITELIGRKDRRALKAFVTNYLPMRFDQDESAQSKHKQCKPVHCSTISASLSKSWRV